MTAVPGTVAFVTDDAALAVDAAPTVKAPAADSTPKALPMLFALRTPLPLD